MTVLEVVEQLQRWAVTYGESQQLYLSLAGDEGQETFVSVRVGVRIGPEGRVACVLVPMVPVGVSGGRQA